MSIISRFRSFWYIFCIAIFSLLIFSGFANSAYAQKRVEVDITSQRLLAYDNGQLIYSFVVSTGKPWWPTPTGTFYPWIKLRYARMQGGNVKQGTYYNLPKVPYVVYFYKGYAIHGTYWHSNFGRPMSHGCVNLRTSNAALLYNWIDMNTPITIYGSTPR